MEKEVHKQQRMNHWERTIEPIENFDLSTTVIAYHNVAEFFSALISMYEVFIENLYAAYVVCTEQ